MFFVKVSRETSTLGWGYYFIFGAGLCGVKVVPLAFPVSRAQGRSLSFDLPV